MANIKKTTIVEDVESDAIINEEEVVEIKKPEPKKATRIKHDPDELILCRSVTFGGLNIIGPKTKMVYEWFNEGDVREVEYQDLASFKALRHRYLFEPFIVVEDEGLLEEWEELKSVYDKLKTVDLRGIFDLPQRQFVAQIKQLPLGVKTSVQNMAYSMIREGTLYDLRKIEAMDEILGTELKMMI